MKMLVLAGLLATASSCAADVDDRPPRWSYISRAIIQPNCATASCHSSLSATAELRFDTADRGYASLMEEGLVVPGAPDQSELIALLRAAGTGEVEQGLRRGGEDGDEAMPPDAPLPEPDIDLIAAWIAAGAEND
jgi:hypothetical protein